MDTQILKRFSVESLVASRDAVVENYEAAAERMRHVKSLMASSAWSNDLRLPRVSIDSDGRSYGHELYDDRTGRLDAGGLRAIDEAFWSYLIDQSGVQQIMSTDAIKKMRESIGGKDCPAFTTDNVRATFAGLAQRQDEMMEELVVSVYRRLSWNHKTNAPARFGAKMILSYCGCDWRDHPWIDYDSPVLDLERALYALDDQPAPTRELSIETLIRGAGYGEWVGAAPMREGTEPVFSIKVFKNRNGHVRVRGDLVDRMNQIVAKAWPERLPWSA